MRHKAIHCVEWSVKIIALTHDDTRESAMKPQTGRILTPVMKCHFQGVMNVSGLCLAEMLRACRIASPVAFLPAHHLSPI